MRDNDGRKLGNQTLEALRIRAVRQIEDGAHPVAVAEALGMRKSTVYGWLGKYREGGEEALKARPVPGLVHRSLMPGRWNGSTVVVGKGPRQL